MVARAALLLALVGAATHCFARGDEAGRDGMANVSDGLGNLITISNHPQGASSYVQLTSVGRYGAVNWDRSHSDGYMERVTSLYVDGGGSLILAGVRLYQSVNYLWVMKYSNSGQLLWERTDSTQGCAAFDVAANPAGDIWIAGSCIDGQNFPVRLLHYDQSGNMRWAQNYNEGGRNYVRNLTVDFIGRAGVTLEVLGGYGRTARTIVYDGYGSRIASY